MMAVLDLFTFCVSVGVILSRTCITCSGLELRSESKMNQIAAQQHEAWATLGFLRGVSSLKLSGQAFCTPEWVKLMMEVITGASPLNKRRPRAKSLLQQVSYVTMISGIAYSISGAAVLIHCYTCVCYSASDAYRLLTHDGSPQDRASVLILVCL